MLENAPRENAQHVKNYFSLIYEDIFMASENRIRELAHQIWESEGRPEGRDKKHWELACELAESEVDVETQRVTKISPLEPLEQLEPMDSD